MIKARAFTTLGVLYGLVAVIALGIGLAVAGSTVTSMASAERTDGTVVAMTSRIESDGGRRNRGSHESWYPVVQFTVDGRQHSFENPTNVDPSEYREGQTVPVAYNPDNPSDARIAAFGEEFLMPSIFGGIAIVFAALCTWMLVKARGITRQRDWLRQHGHEVWAAARVDIERKVKINDRHPYVVRATWQDARTGRAYTATSDYIRHDPGPVLQGRSHVRVLYDPADPARNMVDLDAR